MNKLQSAVEHRPTMTTDLFKLIVLHIVFQLIVQMKCIMELKVLFLSTNETIKEEGKNMVIVETSPLLRKLSHVSVENFHEFAVVFYNHVVRLAAWFVRLDILFDSSFKNSLKAPTRNDNWSSGTRLQIITDDTPFLSNFLTSFLCNTETKHDLGLYLASKIISIHEQLDSSNTMIFLNVQRFCNFIPSSWNRCQVTNIKQCWRNRSENSSTPFIQC